MLVLLCSSDGRQVDRHFGQAAQGYVYRLDASSGRRFFFQEIRTWPPLGEHGCSQPLPAALTDCAYVFCTRIGNPMRRRLTAAGVGVIEYAGPVETALCRLQAYLRLRPEQ